MNLIIIKIGDGMKYWIVLYRSVFFYALIALLYRAMGKREMGELSVMDFIVSIFIAEMVAISIENYEQTIWISIVPILALALIQIGLSYFSMKSQKLRTILDGKPSVIINRGRINFEEMKKQRYNLDDLLAQLRNNSIKSIEEVDFAILETSGKLSIFPKKDTTKDYPLPLIIDGFIEEDTLFQIQKSRVWLQKELEKQNIPLSEVFYGFYKGNNLYIIEKDKIN